MISFQPLTLADRQWIQPLLEMSGFGSEEYNFTFMYIWRNIFDYRAARMGDFLLLKACGNRFSYLYPPGSGDVKPVIDALVRDAEENGHEFIFHTVLAEQVKLLETLFPERFVFSPLTDYFDYVYDAESLMTLRGKKLHGKRNHINKFKELYPDWTYEEITAENLAEAEEMSLEWCRIHDCNSEKTMRDEAVAVREAFDNFLALGLDGGMIRAGGRIVALSMGERLNHDTYLVHIEKAFADVQGAYAIINQEFARRHCEGYLHINREDDSGQPGLRQAKLSYRPAFQVEKFAARLKWY